MSLRWSLSVVPGRCRLAKLRPSWPFQWSSCRPNRALHRRWGLLATDLSYDYSRTQIQLLSNPDLAKITEDYAYLQNLASKQLEGDRISSQDQMFVRIAECRYQGQGYELRVDAPDGNLDQNFISQLIEGFHQVHEREYGKRFDEKDIELVNVRVMGVGRIPELRTKNLQDGGPEPDGDALTAHRDVIFDDGNGKVRTISTPHYDRTRFKCGNIIRGPAIFEQTDTTTLVLPDLVAEVDQFANILIKL